MTDWSRISRIVDFCLSKLNTQEVINAKAEAIRESIRPWYSIYEERNLSSPECHYEATLCKYGSRDHNASIDSVADAHEALIRDTPALLVGRLVFVDQKNAEQLLMGRIPTKYGKHFFVLSEDGTFYVGIPIEEGRMINIYTVEFETW